MESNYISHHAQYEQSSECSDVHINNFSDFFSPNNTRKNLSCNTERENNFRLKQLQNFN